MTLERMYLEAGATGRLYPGIRHIFIERIYLEIAYTNTGRAHPSAKGGTGVVRTSSWTHRCAYAKACTRRQPIL